MIGKVDVTVIIPAFNQAQYLPAALQSVQNQTFRTWECLIIDDGSTDNTAEIARQWVAKDLRFLYVYQSNKGLAGARNTGLDRARGRFIQFLDADDFLLPEKLQRQYEKVYVSRRPALAYSDYFLSDESGQKLSKVRIPPRLLPGRELYDVTVNWGVEVSVPVHCVLADGRFFSEHGIRFNTALRAHEDWDCWVRIFRLSPAVFYTPDRLAVYRIHSSSMMRKKQVSSAELLELIERHKEMVSPSSPEKAWLDQKARLVRMTFGDKGKGIRYFHVLKSLFQRDFLKFFPSAKA